MEQVVINGATKEMGKAAVVAVTKACRMEVAGAVDTCHIRENIGKIFYFFYFSFGVIIQTNLFVMFSLIYF